MKTLIIAIAKNENLYVKEWVDWHLNIGFDNIVICDNNDEDGERISQVIENERVIIKDYVGMSGVQKNAYTYEYFKYKDKYDWICFIDIDEFIFLDKKYNDIKEFISKFENADCIKLCWKIYTDETNLDTEDYRVVERLVDYHEDKDRERMFKPIINTKMEYVGDFIYGHGYFANKDNYLSVNSIGEKTINIWSKINNPSHENCYIRHYPTKTIGEFIRQKYFRGGPNKNNYTYKSIGYFWRCNTRTDEKEYYGKMLINEIKN